MESQFNQLVEDAWGLRGLVEAAVEMLPDHPERAAHLLTSFTQGGWPSSAAASVARKADAPTVERLELARARGYQVGAIISDPVALSLVFLAVEPHEWRQQRERDRSAG